MDAALLPLWYLVREWLDSTITNEQLEQIGALPPQPTLSNHLAHSYKYLASIYNWKYSILSSDSISVCH
jgi:hypothetical protein